MLKIALIFMLLLSLVNADQLSDLRTAFANAGSSSQRAEILFEIAQIYEVNGQTKDAKLLYRRIIKNYSKSVNIVKKSQERLLKL